MKFLNKKNTFLGVFLILFILFLFHLLVSTFWCSAYSWFTYRECYLDRDFEATLFLIGSSLVLLVIPFSLITFPFRPQVFEAWRNFALWAVPLFMVPILFLALLDTPGGFGIGGAMAGGFIALVLLVLYGIYFVTSLIIIAIAAYRK